MVAVLLAVSLDYIFIAIGWLKCLARRLMMDVESWYETFGLFSNRIFCNIIVKYHCLLCFNSFQVFITHVASVTCILFDK